VGKEKSPEPLPGLEPLFIQPVAMPLTYPGSPVLLRDVLMLLLLLLLLLLLSSLNFGYFAIFGYDAAGYFNDCIYSLLYGSVFRFV
jgi:hypothetical protein